MGGEEEEGIERVGESESVEGGREGRKGNRQRRGTGDASTEVYVERGREPQGGGKILVVVI